jgi:hypothetical protein
VCSASGSRRTRRSPSESAATLSDERPANAIAERREPRGNYITLLAKDFLRVIVLGGFRNSPDLEGRMDWAHKGRVLVYERSPTCSVGQRRR